MPIDDNDDLSRGSGNAAGGEQAGLNESATGNAPSVPAEKQGVERGATEGAASTGEAAGGAGASVGSGLARFGYTALAAGTNGTRWAMMAMNNGLRAMMSALTPAGAAVSSAMGGAISPTTGTYAVAGGGSLSLIMTGVMVFSFFLAPDERRFGTSEEECSVDDMQLAGGTTSASGEQLETAKYIYGVFSALGMSDENIAGILGNFESESGVDPTSVEKIHSEPYRIGPLKEAAEEHNFAGSYLGLPVSHVGIGLGQWTNDRGVKLREFAEANNRDWYDAELQLAYMIGPDSSSGLIQEMIANKNPGADNPGDAANHVLRKWEIPKDMDGQEPIRREQASKWYAQMGGWSADQAAADSVLQMAETELTQAHNNGVKAQLADCPAESMSGGNEDAATAFATFAFPYTNRPASEKGGMGNDGTYMYIWLRDEIFPGDPYYASCDRGVATAVTWSGTDDSMPIGPTDVQYEYLATSDKWEEVTAWSQSNGTEHLKPGDILVTTGNGHIGMYLGPDIPMEVWGEGNYTEGADMGESSLNDHSPRLLNYWMDTDGQPYKAYRNVKSEENSEFSSLTPPKTEPGTGPQRWTTPPP